MNDSQGDVVFNSKDISMMSQHMMQMGSSHQKRPPGVDLNYMNKKKKKLNSTKQIKSNDDGYTPRVFTPKSARVKSTFRGVCWDTRKQKWKSQIGHHGETLYLGHHDRETDAALAYDMAARKLHGHKARCNYDPLGFRTKFSGNTSMGSGYTKPKPPTGYKTLVHGPFQGVRNDDENADAQTKSASQDEVGTAMSGVVLTSTPAETVSSVAADLTATVLTESKQDQ